MTREQLFEQIRAKRSFLCVGLDTDVRKIPLHLRGMLHGEMSPMEHSKRVARIIFQFNRDIIDATAQYAVAYKPNLAFYEAIGWTGIGALALTCDYVKENYPEILVIADAKRGDIGNTSEMYAEAFLG